MADSKYTTDHLSPFYVEIAERELKENDQNRTSALEDLKKLIEAEDNLYIPLDEVRLLLPFLRICKFDPKKAFDRLKSYYKGCSRYSDDFEQVLPSKMATVLRQNVQVVLPQKNLDGTRIVYVKFGNWDPEKFPVTEMFRCDWLLAEKLTEDEEIQIAGVRVVYNVREFGIQHLKQMNPSMMYKASNVGFRGLPVRCKGVHVVFENPFLRTAFMMAKPFLPRKIKNRFNFHGEDMASLHQHVDPNILPRELGGMKDDYTNDHLINELLSWESAFIERRKYGYRTDK